jgi:hypothetical protein
MPKNKLIAARNLTECLPSLPLKTRKAKTKIKVFFIATILCFPEVYTPGLQETQHAAASSRMCRMMHTSAYVSIHQHTSASVYLARKRRSTQLRRVQDVPHRSCHTRRLTVKQQ